MPKREDEYQARGKEALLYCSKHKRYYRADVGCQLCGYENLRLKGMKKDRPKLMECPKCDNKSLSWNVKTELFECLNTRCKSKFTLNELMKGEKSYKASIQKRVKRILSAYSRMILRPQKALLRSRWLLTALGLAIIFACIAYYPSLLQNWRFGRLDLIIWLEIPIEVLGGFLVLISLFVKRHRSRMRGVRTFLILLILFTGATYTYHILDESGKIDEWLRRSSSEETISGNIKGMVPSIVESLGDFRLVTPETTSTTAPPESSITPTQESTKINTSKVWIGNSYLVGGDWKPIIIVNNPGAKNPSWKELAEFLKQDDTDRQEYDINRFVCANFAEMLHNNAEKAGWRCAYVSVKLSGYRDFANLGIPASTGHALNAFETTDRGLVYIDCVNSPLVSITNADKLVDIKPGKQYIPQSIFPEPGWAPIWESMGTVTEIETVQW